MAKRPRPSAADPFEIVKNVALELPGVETTTRYDGATVLTVGGSFMAGLASHPSAEPASLVVRSNLEEREWLLQDAPDTYYVTDYYRKYPLVLVRLARIDREALRDLLSVSRQLTLDKVQPRRQSQARRRPSGVR